MPLNAHQFQLYLNRVKYKGDRSATKVNLETLQLLHEAHVNTIPFENFEIHLGHEINLDEKSIFDKMVIKNRGGYCFESNELLALALEYCGFIVHRSVSRIVFPEVRSRSHKILFVEIPNSNGKELWLADIGFSGNSLRLPLQIPKPTGQTVDTQNQDQYKLVSEQDKFNNIQFRLQTKMKAGWVDLYNFNLLETYPIDYEIPHYYLSHNLDSPFVQHIICAKPTADGRIILMDNKLKIRIQHETMEQLIANSDQYFKILKEIFDISLTREEQEKIKRKLFISELVAQYNSVSNERAMPILQKDNKLKIEDKQAIQLLTGKNGPALGMYIKTASPQASSTLVQNLSKPQEVNRSSELRKSI